MPSSLPAARVWMPKALGMEGPVISASRMPTFLPRPAMAQAREEVTRLLPTPPFPLTTAMTFLTWESSWAGAWKLWGLVRSEQLSPQEEQLWVHSDMGRVPSFLYFSRQMGFICNGRSRRR